MKVISKFLVGAALVVTGLLATAVPATAAEGSPSERVTAPTAVSMGKPATCVQGLYFEAPYQSGTNTSVLLRNNCAGTVRVQAQYKVHASGTVKYQWGPCKSIGGGGKTWSSPVYWVNWAGNGSAWASNGGGKALMQTC